MKDMNMSKGLVATLMLVLLTACASSTPPPAPSGRGSAPPASVPAAGRVVLSSEQIALVRAYYGGQEEARGNGRGRNGGLPPGIARNLARGKPLPPGIAKQYLPNDLLLRLPPLERGLDYLVVAGKLLLVEAATQRIREVLLDAVFA
jgi:hypothetical protein